ncbi:hypothetical protein L2K70_18215 [Nocardioides KLBMP 9356]|uniref:Calcium-binding protein n=1 Tax=Nocardioides potassii TaxID=2911371 RepID=A0ABS9HHF0_9ACTN|nr:calcium-binding protein [Nocardioides potassii]MCF6379551.1 hypothetical protein [Nocardioides potassii]
MPDSYGPTRVPPRRRAALATALTIPLTIPLTLIAAAPSHAEPLTCQGRTVTVEGSTGTPGDDVMVVGQTLGGGASAGEGSDLVCVRITSSSEPFVFTVDAGPGDDTVVNESTDGNASLTVVLGAGSDAYTGSETGEAVHAGTGDWSRLGGSTDTERDVIDTRGGGDSVYSGSIDAGSGNRDQLTLGEGDDRLHWAGVQAGPTPDLGGGANTLHLYRGWQGNDLAVDPPTGTAAVDGRPVLRWSGAVTSWTVLVDNLRTTFTGTDANERVVFGSGSPVPSQGLMAPPSPDARRTVDLRGGDDSLVFYDTVGGDLVGGDGRDRVELGYCVEGAVRVGVAYTCLRNSSPRLEFTGAMDAWEEVVLAGAYVSLVGTESSEVLRGSGASIRMSGRGGDDLLTASRQRSTMDARRPVVMRGGDGDDILTGTYGDDRLVGGAGGDRVSGSSGADLLLGGSGRDRLSGGKGADRVRGGTGRDRADGYDGRDTCAAEVRRSCER